ARSRDRVARAPRKDPRHVMPVSSRRSSKRPSRSRSRRDVQSVGRSPRLNRLRDRRDMPANIVVPEVGESIVDARVAKWLKKQGDVVSAGDPLVELETDKIDLEVAAPQAGVLSRIDHTDGADVKVGEVLGVIEERGASTGASRAEGQEASPAKAGEATVKASAAVQGPADKDKTRATPTARKAAQQNEVDLKQVRGGGDAGRVRRGDVEQAAQAPASAQVSAQQSGRASQAPAASTPQKTRPATPVSEDRRRSEGERTEERVRMSKRRATI